MRRSLLATTAALLLIVSACGGSSDSGTGATTDCPVDALDGATGPVEVVMWETFTGEPLRMMQELVERYNASQDRVVVRMESQGASYAEMQRKFITAIGSGGVPALIPLEETQTQFMADSGAIVSGQSCADADGYDLGAFLPSVVETYTVDGALQPAGLDVSTPVMYYNRDHFSTAGLDPDDPPTTLDELRAAAEALKAAGASERPFVLLLAPQFVEQWLTGADATIVNNDNGHSGLATESTFANATTTELYQWLADMNADGLLNPIPGTDAQVDHYFAMALGQSSITVETSTAISTINAVLEGSVDPAELGLDLDELPPIDINVDVAPFPGVTGAGRTTPGGGAFYLPSGNSPEVIAGAWDFMKWFNSATTQADWMIGSTYMAWNAAAYDEPVVVDWEASTRPGRWLSVAVEQIAGIAERSPAPLIGPYTDVRSAIRRSLDELLLADIGVTEAVDGASAAIDEALRRYDEENF
jgi:sn-glycerol 3-phosphate transport system substrate-binding protein